jgi:hypothetical protein
MVTMLMTRTDDDGFDGEAMERGWEGLIEVPGDYNLVRDGIITLRVMAECEMLGCIGSCRSYAAENIKSNKRLG